MFLSVFLYVFVIFVRPINSWCHRTGAIWTRAGSMGSGRLDLGGPFMTRFLIIVFFCFVVVYLFVCLFICLFGSMGSGRLDLGERFMTRF